MYDFGLFLIVFGCGFLGFIAAIVAAEELNLRRHEGLFQSMAELHELTEQHLAKVKGAQ